MPEPSFQRKRKTAAKRAAPAAARDAAEAVAAQAGRLGPRYAARPAYDLACDGRAPSRDEQEQLPQPDESAAAEDFAEQMTRAPSGGEPLEPALRARLEQRFGRDLSQVRVHKGSDAGRAAGALEAAAFTRGRHIFLASPQDAADVRLLSHELAHSVQQGAAPPLRFAASRPLGAAQSPVPRTASPAPASAAPGPAAAVQRFDIWGAARRVGGAVASGIRAVGGAVRSAGEHLLELGRDALLAIVRRVAPDFLPLFQGDGIGGFIRKLIRRGLRSLFDGLLAPLRKVIDFGAIGKRVTQAMSWISTIAAQLANNDCSGILAAARRVGAFFSSALKPVIDRVKSIAHKVEGFFHGIWDAIGAPVMEMLRKIGGTIWNSLKGFVRDAGRLIARVRSALGRAWTKVKGWLGIGAEDGTSEGGGLWNWIRDKAKAIGESISGVIRPVIGPLRTVGGVLLMIVPGGQLVGVMLLWPKLKQAYDWLARKWSDLNLIPRARAFLANTVIPAVMHAAEAVAQALLRGADWLLGLLDRVAGALARAAEAAAGILTPLRALIRFAYSQFHRIVTWARGGLRYVSRHFRSLMQRLIRFLQPILEALKKLIGIALNPFGIVGFLAGSIWKLIPECLKGPIIDFIIGVLLRVVRALPDSPLLGILWPFVRAGLLGFLEKVQSYKIERKVKVANKMANIVAGGSLEFTLGYLKGLALGVWDAVIAPIKGILGIFELPEKIMGFLNNMGVRLCDLVEDVRCFLASLAGNVFGTADQILGKLAEILQNPSQIIDMIKCALEAALSGARSLGAQLADRMMAIFEGAESAMGEMLGKVTGSLLANALITYFTAGTGAVAGVIGKVSSLLGKVGEALAEAVQMLRQLLGKLVELIKTVASKLAGAVARGARGVLSKAGGFFKKVAAWFRKIFGKLFGWLKKKFMLTPLEREQWALFEAELHAALGGHPAGITRRELRGLYKGILARFKPVAKWPAFITKHGPNWRLWVRRTKSILPRRVGEVKMDHERRWLLATRAVKRRMLWVSRRDRNEARLDAILQPIKRRWGFTELYARRDSAEHDFNIMGAMSAAREITEVDDGILHYGTRRDPIPINWYKPPGSYLASIRLRPYPGAREKITAPKFGNTPVQARGGEVRRVGIIPTNQIGVGRTITLTGTPADEGARAESAKFGRLMSTLGFSMRNRDVDHVRDLAFGGRDVQSNLWPLATSINRRASTMGNWYSTYRIEYKKREGGRKTADNKPIGQLHGKVFKVVGTRYPPPMPGGRSV